MHESERRGPFVELFACMRCSILHPSSLKFTHYRYGLCMKLSLSHLGYLPSLANIAGRDERHFLCILLLFQVSQTSMGS